MTPSKSARRALLLALAILFAAVTVLYSVIWMFAIRRPFGDIGFRYTYALANRSLEVSSVETGSAADQAGLHAGDLIVAINGQLLDSALPSYRAFVLGKVGDVLQLTVNRLGANGPLTIHEVIQPFRFSGQPTLTASQLLAARALNLYPLLFLVVGLPVLFVRLEDRNAWLLALLFGGFIAGAPLDEAVVPAFLRGFAISYRVILSVLEPALFYLFFATFPASSVIDRRVPWLKWALLGTGTVTAVPLGVWCLLAGGSLPFHILGSHIDGRPVNWLTAGYLLGSYILGLGSLVWNSIRPESADVRRKTRVIVWGTVAGFVPMLVFGTVASFAHLAITDVSFWIWVFAVASLLLIPLSFGYAVVKHRVLEIPVLLKRSARYVLVQRGFIVVLFIAAAAAIALFTHTFNRLFQTDSNMGMGLSAVFGIVLVWASAPVVKRGSERIDRAFFRSSYDARQVLENLAQKTRRATARENLAALLQGEIVQALHPTSMAVYLEGREGRLTLQGRGARPTLEPIVSPDAPLLRDLARRGEPWEVPVAGSDGPGPSLFGPIQPECLVPMVSGDGRLTGVLVLGARLSEEPYSREDKRLLASVTSQAGVALENIRLAEEMAQRLEVERRVAQEMEFAKQVQSRLFPQNWPTLETLNYAGGCIQARQVGGDYYDFLELRSGRLGLVLADVAGKGISGALIMANLQANLRSQYAMAVDDLGGLLASVNRLFHQNTADGSYATLFFGDYDDSSRRLRYVNCGHLPPLLLRAGWDADDPGSAQPRVERLHSTCTVLGLFEDWQVEVAEVQFAPGDTLVLYTDGVTEAPRADGEEFGESRLIDTLRAHCGFPPATLLEAIVEAVRQFSPGEQQDDITLVVARCTA